MLCDYSGLVGAWRARPICYGEAVTREDSMLSAAAILAEAEARAGMADPETWLKPNLEALVASLNTEAGLSDAGETATHDYLVTRTAERIEGLKWLRDHPEI